MSTFDPRLDMDDAMRHALALYHQRIEEEKQGNGGPHRHMAVGPAAGRFINLLASSLDAPKILELGTSLGYSTLWLADAARTTGGQVTTIELEAEKSAIAKEMAEDIHKALEANRPEHGKIDRPEPPAEVKEKADAVRGFHQQLGEARHDLHKALRDASDEDRKAMIAAFKRGEDIHSAVAAEVFEIDPGAVIEEQRDAAKMINFGIVYGITAWGLARNLGESVSVEDKATTQKCLRDSVGIVSQ